MLADARRAASPGGFTAYAAEFHHELKNELQLLVSLAERTGADPRFQTFLIALAAVHDVLHHDPLAPDAVQLIRRLADEAWRKLADQREFRIHAPDAPVLVDPRHARVLALIAHELVLNAFRHSQASTVTVALYPEGPECQLMVEDNGRGLPPGFDAGTNPGFGLQLAARLAVEHFGKPWEVRSAQGTGATIVVRFPTLMNQMKGG